jgi:hypothetical protein
MNENQSIAEHDNLNRAFSSGSVLRASRKELERLLLATAECKPSAEENKDRNNRRADVVRHLLQVRISEEFQERTFRLSVAAFFVSLAALGVTLFRFWHELRH